MAVTTKAVGFSSSRIGSSGLILGDVLLVCSMGFWQVVQTLCTLSCSIMVDQVGIRVVSFYASDQDMEWWCFIACEVVIALKLMFMEVVHLS